MSPYLINLPNIYGRNAITRLRLDMNMLREFNNKSSELKIRKDFQSLWLKCVSYLEVKVVIWKEGFSYFDCQLTIKVTNWKL